ncbi:hypothetical protein DICA4_F06876 [Diutina catenulata]
MGYPIERFSILRERETAADEIKRFLVDQPFDGPTLWQSLWDAAEEKETRAFLKKHEKKIKSFTTRTEFRRWFFIVDRSMIGRHLSEQAQYNRLIRRRPALDKVDFFDAIDKVCDANYLLNMYSTRDYVLLLSKTIFSRYPAVVDYLTTYINDPAHENEDIIEIMNKFMMELPGLLPASAYNYLYKL